MGPPARATIQASAPPVKNAKPGGELGAVARTAASLGLLASRTAYVDADAPAFRDPQEGQYAQRRPTSETGHGLRTDPLQRMTREQVPMLVT